MPYPYDGFPHVLEAQQFSETFLQSLFRVAEAIRSRPEAFQGILLGRTVGLLFAQPSSRTFHSFELAAKQLGATVIGSQHMTQFSSVAKGESLEDTVRTFLQYDINYFVIRWDTEGSVARAAAIVGPERPVINAGDGMGQHPTQALLDVYTIWREFKDLDRPIVVAIIGDLKRGRTAHSLAYLLGKVFPQVSFFFISPESCRMKPEIIDYLCRHNRHFAEIVKPQLYDLAHAFDVVYVTRPQLEYEDGPGQERLTVDYQPFILTAEIADLMKPEAIILHPLPRTFELPVEVDANPRARYFEQMGNGFALRRALFERINEALIGAIAAHRQH